MLIPVIIDYHRGYFTPYAVAAHHRYPAAINQSMLIPTTQWMIATYQIDCTRSVIHPNARPAGIAENVSVIGLPKCATTDSPV